MRRRVTTFDYTQRYFHELEANTYPLIVLVSRYLFQRVFLDERFELRLISLFYFSNFSSQKFRTKLKPQTKLLFQYNFEIISKVLLCSLRQAVILLTSADIKVNLSLYYASHARLKDIVMQLSKAVCTC